MGKELNKNKVLATLLILILLGLLVGMVWYDRQQRAALESKASQEIQPVQTQVAMDEQSESLNTDLTSGEGSTESNSGEFPFQGLNMKETPQTFEGQTGVVKIRSFGGLQTVTDLTNLTNVTSDSYTREIERLQSLGLSIETNESNGIDYSLIFDYMAPYLNYADITMAQLGMPVAYPQLPQSNGETMNAPRALLAQLSAMGVDILSTASQHSLDKGNQGIIATLNNIEDNNMEAIGTSKNTDSVNTPLIKDINGVKVGFLSYTSVMDETVTEEDQALLINTTNNIDFELIRQYADENDALVVTIQHDADVSQEDRTALYQSLSDAGVSVIIGNNLVDVQPIEWINGDQTVAIHSQANMMAEGVVSTLVEFGFQKEADGIVKILVPKVMPMVFSKLEDSEYLKLAPLADAMYFKFGSSQTEWQDFVDQIQSVSTDLEVYSHLESNLFNEDQDNFRE